MRFIVERASSGRWSCYEEAHQNVACEGVSPSHALERCCAAFGINAMAFRPTRDAERFVYIEARLCSECCGTGRQHGGTTGETCTACNGTGVT
jgi:hypothetical protein